MPPSPPAPPLDPLELRSALLHLIDDLQHPPDCSTAPLYVYLPTAYTSGLGSQVRMIASSMLQAIVLRRTFVVDAAASVYVHPSRCPDRGYDCLFLPLSNCTLADAMIEIDGSSSSTHNAAATPPPPPPPSPLPSPHSTASLASHRARLGELTRAAVPAGHPHPRVVSGRSSCYKISAADSQALHARVLAMAAAITEQHSPLTRQPRLSAKPSGSGPISSVIRPISSVGPISSIEPSISAEPPSAAWWVQQLVGHVARPSARIQAFADETARELGLSDDLSVGGGGVGGGGSGGGGDVGGGGGDAGSGYIGVHIRRGDKRNEAMLHSTSEYASLVEQAAAQQAAAGQQAAPEQQAAAAQQVHSADAPGRVLLASDDTEPYDSLPGLLLRWNVTWIPTSRFRVGPSTASGAALVASKMIEGDYLPLTSP